MLTHSLRSTEISFPNIIRNVKGVRELSIVYAKNILELVIFNVSYK